MYKYKVQYRVYLSNSKPGDNHPTLSGRKDLEFKLKERLVKDGPGRWKNTLINVIKQNDPSVTYVYDDMILKDLGFEKESISSSQNQISQENSTAIYASKVEENRISRESRWAEKDRQREKDERQRLIDLEEQRLRDEKEARERAERIARANELRSQGKNLQAFLVEFQNGVIAGSVIIGLALFFFIFNMYKEGNKADAMKINSELEQIEDSVKIYINSQNFDKALVLANRLVHPSHEDMEHLEFDSWSGYPKFDEYWTKKREEYKDIILKKGTINSKIEEANQTLLPEFIEAIDEITIEAIADKIYFYDNPSEDFKTKGYFVKGQQGKLLGEAGDFSKVRFEFNGKITEKFVLTNEIQEVDTYIPTETDTEGLDPEYQEN